jgi:hypothetical protein
MKSLNDYRNVREWNIVVYGNFDRAAIGERGDTIKTGKPWTLIFYTSKKIWIKTCRFNLHDAKLRTTRERTVSTVCSTFVLRESTKPVTSQQPASWMDLSFWVTSRFCYDQGYGYMVVMSQPLASIVTTELGEYKASIHVLYLLKQIFHSRASELFFTTLLE